MVIFVAAALGMMLFGAMSLAEPAAYDLIAWNPSRPMGGWRRWRPRKEVSPRLQESSEEGGTLVAGGGGIEYCIGGWERDIRGIKEGDAFHVHADVECEDAANAPRSLWIRVYWSGELPAGTPPEVIRIADAGEGRYVFDDRVAVPRGAVAATLRVIYRWDGDGRAVFRNLRMVPAGPEPGHRFARIATVYWRPKARTTVEKNLAQWLKMVDKAAKGKPDFIVLSEGITSVGIGLADLDAVSEKVPGGAYFSALAARAKRYGTHICYGTYEREGRYIFNTAALIGRDGRLIGKYRKNHLPLEEDTVGLAPGSSIDVFDTDICRAGIAVCFEIDFPEVMRVLALKGAEVILVPVWGGDELTVKARARENGVNIVTASYDMKCMIIDRRGAVVAETWKGIGTGVAAATVDLDDRTKTPWTGDFPGYFRRIRMPEMFGEIAE